MKLFLVFDSFIHIGGFIHRYLHALHWPYSERTCHFYFIWRALSDITFRGYMLLLKNARSMPVYRPCTIELCIFTCHPPPEGHPLRIVHRILEEEHTRETMLWINFVDIIVLSLYLRFPSIKGSFRKSHLHGTWYKWYYHRHEVLFIIKGQWMERLCDILSYIIC